MPKDEFKSINMDESGKALLYAASQNQTSVVLKLLKRGVNVNVTNQKNQTPIEIAAKNKNWKLVLQFLHYPISLEVLNIILFQSILDNQYNVAFALLMKGANPCASLEKNFANIEAGDTALHLAVRQNSPEMIHLLYRFSENYFIQNKKEDLSPYLLAAKLGFWDKAIPAFWAIEDFEKTRYAFIHELTKDGYRVTHRQRAQSLIDAALRQTKTLKELLALIEFEIDLFHPVHRNNLFKNISPDEYKKLPKYEQLPKNKKDEFNIILQKYQRIIFQKISNEMDDKSENIDHYFKNLEGFSSVKPVSMRSS